MNWLLTLSCAVTGVLLRFYRENRLRSRLDESDALVDSTRELLLPVDAADAADSPKKLAYGTSDDAASCNR